MSKKTLGLDIRNDGVSAVIIKNGIKGKGLEANQYVPVSDQQDVGEGLSACLKTLTEKIDPKDTVCIASIPADQVSYRNIQVPFKDQRKIRQILPFELAPSLAVSIDNLIIDFQVIKSSRQPSYSSLIAAAVEKIRLKSFLDTLASFEIDPIIVTPGSYPAVMWIARHSDLPKNGLVVDIDNRNWTLYALISGRICLVRSFPFGHHASSQTGSISTNIKRSIIAIEEILGLDFQAESIFITGPCRDDIDFKQDLGERLEIPVNQIDLAHNADTILSNVQAAQSADPCRFDNAFALAMVDIEGLECINFRRGPLAAKKYWVEQKKNIITTSILTGAVLILVLLNIFIETTMLGKKVALLDRQIIEIFKATFPEVNKIVDPLQQMKVKIKEAKKNLLPGVANNNAHIIDILNQISKLIPDKTDVVFTRLVKGAENITISGETDTFNSVDEMKSLIEQVEFFQKVTINSANVDKSGNRVHFKLKLQI